MADAVGIIPQRIQLSRRKGWRLTDHVRDNGYVIVDRRTQWGNPIVVETGCQNTATANRRLAVLAFKWLLFGPDWDRAPYPSDECIRAELGGRDLACWCPIEDESGNRQPCHGDVLLTIANPDVVFPWNV